MARTTRHPASNNARHSFRTASREGSSETGVTEDLAAMVRVPSDVDASWARGLAHDLARQRGAFRLELSIQQPRSAAIVLQALATNLPPSLRKLTWRSTVEPTEDTLLQLSRWLAEGHLAALELDLPLPPASLDELLTAAECGYGTTELVRVDVSTLSCDQKRRLHAIAYRAALLREPPQQPVDLLLREAREWASHGCAACSLDSLQWALHSLKGATLSAAGSILLPCEVVSMAKELKTLLLAEQARIAGMKSPSPAQSILAWRCANLRLQADAWCCAPEVDTTLQHHHHDFFA